MNNDIINDFKEYAKNPAKWCKRYQNQCSPKEDNMSALGRRVKYKFQLIKGTGKQKWHWRAMSCNGRIVCSSETFLNKSSPIKTVQNFVEAIRMGQYKFEDM